MSSGIFKGFLLACYSTKTFAFKDSFFYRNALVAASKKIGRTSYLAHYNFPCNLGLLNSLLFVYVLRM